MDEPPEQPYSREESEAHRLLFGLRLKNELVTLTGRLAAGGLVFLAIAMLGAVLLIVDVVLNAVAAGIVTGLIAMLVLWLWYLVPARSRASRTDETER